MNKRGDWLVKPAPAKLNLFLHITGRRDDGMHNLQTLFQFIDYSDEIAARCRQDGVISLQDDVLDICVEDNLVMRAAKLLQQASQTELGADIRLDKHLPAGGGLGGGSSDAATTLVILNELWQCGLSQQQLADIGLQLGADVPIFVHGQAAWAEGVGEQFSPVELPQPWYFVIQPNISVNTGEIFCASELTRDCPPITIRDFLAGHATNVCEPVVRQRYQEVDNALNWLGNHAEARMTGTGSCIFAAFDNEQQAKTVQAELPENWSSFVAQGCNQSPLYRSDAAES